MSDESKPQPLKILVADNDGIYLEMMRDVLLDYGYDVITCSSMDEGYERICALMPDVVIVDLLFPGIKQGIDLVTMMRLNRQTQHIPVIICSAATKVMREMEDHLRSSRLELLYKPFDLDDLHALIGRLRQQSVHDARLTADSELP
jgi:CheY-like chemotaxis protein